MREARSLRRLQGAIVTLGIALCVGAANCAFATELTPSRYSIAPGDSLRVSVDPPMAAQKPAGVRLFLAREGISRSRLETELRISDWKGDSFVAEFPCNARYDASGGVLVLAREANDGRGRTFMAVLADSVAPNVATRVISVRSVSCAGRLKWDGPDSTVTRGAETGALSRRPANSSANPSSTRPPQ
jgi:hypothetical protein